MDHYLGLYRDATGGKIGQHGLRAMMFDSWEASFANWTPAVIADFKRLRGYDPDAVAARPWPGIVIDTPERSDAFLWDWRRTLQQLLKVNHYEQLTETLHGVGMFRYGEAHEERLRRHGRGHGDEVSRPTSPWAPCGRTTTAGSPGGGLLHRSDGVGVGRAHLRPEPHRRRSR
jgi:hypothetical protein